jgi:hypothetical protein
MRFSFHNKGVRQGAPQPVRFGHLLVVQLGQHLQLDEAVFQRGFRIPELWVSRLLGLAFEVSCTVKEAAKKLVADWTGNGCCFTKRMSNEAASKGRISPQ